MLVVSDTQRISKVSDTRMLTVDNPVVEIQVGSSLSRGGVLTGSRGGLREKAI
jgi:hypothetical protein